MQFDTKSKTCPIWNTQTEIKQTYTGYHTVFLIYNAIRTNLGNWFSYRH